MINTIDYAISMYSDLAKTQMEKSHFYRKNKSKSLADACYEDAKDSERMLGWLKELKQYREKRTSDCISREDALLCLTGEFEKNKEYSPEELIAMFGKRIRKLPPVTPTVDRISCSDRMPEKDKEVFVYLFDNSPYIAWWDGEKWHTEDFILNEYDEPLEWYELPKPFEP